MEPRPPLAGCLRVYVGSAQEVVEVVDLPSPATTCKEVADVLRGRLALSVPTGGRYALVVTDRLCRRFERRRVLGLLAPAVPPLSFHLVSPLILCPVDDLPIAVVEETIKRDTSRVASTLVWVFAMLPTPVLGLLADADPALFRLTIPPPPPPTALPPALTPTRAPVLFEPVIDACVRYGSELRPSSAPAIKSVSSRLGVGVLANLDPVQYVGAGLCGDGASAFNTRPPSSRINWRMATQQRLLLAHVQALGKLFGLVHLAVPNENMWQEVWMVLLPESLFYWHTTGGRVESNSAQGIVFDDAVAAYAISDTDFEVYCCNIVYLFRTTPEDKLRWINAISSRRTLISDSDIIEMAEAQMSVQAAGDAMRDRRLFLSLSKVDEVLHTSCIRTHFLKYAVDNHCGESLQFWIHACVYELAHPLSFTVVPSAGGTPTVQYPAEDLSAHGTLQFPSAEAKITSIAHARYLFKRFIAAGAPQQISLPSKYLAQVKSRLSSGAPDVFFETRSVVEADIFQSLFVKFTQTPQFSELRKRSPQLLRSWRDRLSAERSNAKRVVVATRRVSSLLASPLPAEDEFVMVTPGMCTPTVPAVPPMFRPQGRVAAQLRQLAAAASASSPAAGREAEAEGPSRHYSRSENEDFYLTTFCNGVAVDRGVLRAIMSEFDLDGVGTGLLHPSPSAWTDLWCADPWPDGVSSGPSSFSAFDDVMSTSVRVPSLRLPAAPEFDDILDDVADVERSDLWKLQDWVATAILIEKELEELEIEDYVVEGLMPELAHNTRALNRAVVVGSGGGEGDAYDSDSPTSLRGPRSHSTSVTTRRRSRLLSDPQQLLHARQSLQSTVVGPRKQSMDLASSSPTALGVRARSLSDVSSSQDLALGYDQQAAALLADLGWKTTQLGDCVQGSGPEAPWFLPEPPVSLDAGPGSAVYAVLTPEGRGAVWEGPPLAEVVKEEEVPPASPPVSRRSMQGWVRLKWREYGGWFGLPISFSERDMGCGATFIDLRMRYLKTCGSAEWPWTRFWAVLYSDGMLGLAMSDLAGLREEHEVGVSNSEGSRVDGGGFWTMLQVPGALEVCQTKNVEDPGHAVEILTNRGVLSVVPEDAATCGDWLDRLQTLGPMQVPEKGVIYRGCLYKKGRFNRSWKLRFLFLTMDGDQAHLKYYDLHEDGMPNALKGTIDFAAGKVLSIDPLPASEAQKLMSSTLAVYGFTITTPERTWQFLASNPEDVVVWMLCIRRFQQSRSDAILKRVAPYVKPAGFGNL